MVALSMNCNNFGEPIHVAYCGPWDLSYLLATNSPVVSHIAITCSSHSSTNLFLTAHLS